MEPMLLCFVAGQPISRLTTAFLGWVLVAVGGKQTLLLGIILNWIPMRHPMIGAKEFPLHVGMQKIPKTFHEKILILQFRFLHQPLQHLDKCALQRTHLASPGAVEEGQRISTSVQMMIPPAEPSKKPIG